MAGPIRTLWLSNHHNVDIGFLSLRLSYQHLIGAYANAGNLSKVTELVDTMDDKRLYLTDKIYNYHLQCHLKIG